jgi:hypothetical protein
MYSMFTLPLSSPNNETKLYASYLGYKTEVINIDGKLGIKGRNRKAERRGKEIGSSIKRIAKYNSKI